MYLFKASVKASSVYLDFEDEPDQPQPWGDLLEKVRALEVQKGELQQLVCQLLEKNETLRMRLQEGRA